MILITGAAGKTGQAVIEHLVAQEQSVRGWVRRREQGDHLLALGAEETIVGNLSDQAVWQRAMRGVQAIYHICPNMHPEEFIIGTYAIQAAQRAGVDRFVYHSVLHPQTEAMPHHWQKLRVEECLLESGLLSTILQPAAYMQNVLGYWDSIVNKGEYAVPYRISTRLSMVDLDNVAEVAAQVLIQPGFQDATFELCGPDLFTQQQLARLIGEHLGCEVLARSVGIEQWAVQARASGLDEYALKSLMKMFQYYEKYDFRGNSKVLGWLLGRPPTTFAQFLKRVKDTEHG